MADDKRLQDAQTVYNTLCGILDDKEIKYNKTPEHLMASFLVSGNDLSIGIIAMVDPEKELIRMFTQLTFSFDEDKRLEGALATCSLNLLLADGSFDYDFSTGEVLFRITSSYKDSIISRDLVGYMIACLLITIVQNSDKLLKINSGELTVEDLFSKS